MTERRSIDHALRILLEEHLGGAAPPDLTERIQAAARSGAEPIEPRRAPRAPARRRRARSLVSVRRLWWIVPLLVVLGVLGLLLFFADSAPALFIYTMF